MYSLVNFKNEVKQYLVYNEEQSGTIPIADGKKFDEGAFILIIDDDLEFVSFIKELLGNMGAQVAIALNGTRLRDVLFDAS